MLQFSVTMFTPSFLPFPPLFPSPSSPQVSVCVSIYDQGKDENHSNDSMAEEDDDEDKAVSPIQVGVSNTRLVCRQPRWVGVSPVHLGVISGG